MGRSMFAENCPDHNPSLSGWNPGHQPEKAYVVRRGHLLRLDASATLQSLTIQSGGEQITVEDSSGDLLECNTCLFFSTGGFCGQS